MTTGETYRALDAKACADAVERLLARTGDALSAETAARARAMPDVVAQFEGQLAIYSNLLRDAGRKADPPARL